MPISVVTIIDRDRQWFATAEGLVLRKTPREQALCAHAICESHTLVIPNAVDASSFRDNPLLVGAPGIRLCAGAVCAPNGMPLRTPCVIERVAHATLDTKCAEMLIALGRQVEALLEERRLARELEKIQRAKQELVRFAIHDLRNALTAVWMLAHALATHRALHPALASITDDLATALTTMRRIVQGLGDNDRAERGELVVRCAPVGLARLLGDVARRWTRPAHARGVFVEVRCEPAAVASIDMTLIERVLDNLVANAIDFAPAGTAVTISARSTGSGCELAVADAGPGIAPADRGRLFDLYAIGSSAPVHHRAATGIGLAFCRLAVDAHGGRIWVDNNVPRGSVFRIELPDGPAAGGEPVSTAAGERGGR